MIGGDRPLTAAFLRGLGPLTLWSAVGDGGGSTWALSAYVLFELCSLGFPNPPSLDSPSLPIPKPQAEKGQTTSDVNRDESFS